MYGKSAEIERQPYPKGTLNYLFFMNYPFSSSTQTIFTRVQVAELISGSQGVNLKGDDAIKFLLVNDITRGKVESAPTVANYKGGERLTSGGAVAFLLNARNNGTADLQRKPELTTDLTEIHKKYITK
ncbi:hypothetical protein [Bacillus sp. FJAT-45350]|uniref:hypothetical protein n=1 Tax=Bacillus sp. FJAT-45350 TaxID=2011014 RepID=UPI000BB8C1EE|nr:hypothetical protein [Bacillus sp. FJAT-45350]